MARPLRVLVVSHDASRTGAPLVLLTFLRWIRGHTDAAVELVLWRGGPLVGSFTEVVDRITVLHPPPGQRSASELVEDGLAKVGLGAIGHRLRSARIARRLHPGPHDVRWLNGAGSALVLAHPVLDSSDGAPAVAHVHELERGLSFSLRGPGRETFLGADRVVAVSRAVADLLVADWGVDLERVVVVPGCLPDRPSTAVPDPPVTLPAGVPVVLSVGSGGWRKGIDHFLALAAAVRDRVDDVHFAWVGALEDEVAVRSEAAALGLTEVLALPGEVGDPTPWYERADVFVSTAREDPFPLVALEAGAAGLPIVAFDSGGIRELLDDRRGHLVGAQDVAAAADAVVRVLEDDGGAGPRLQAHVMAHHIPAAMGDALWAVVTSIVGRRPGTPDALDPPDR